MGRLFPLPTWVRVCLGIRDQGKPMQNPQGRVWNHRERTACRLLFCSASFPLRPKLTCPGMALLNYLLNQSANMLVSVVSRSEYDLAFEYDFFLGSVAGNPASLTPRDTANKPSCFESQRVNLDAAVVYNEDQREVIPVPPVFSHHRLHGISNTLGSRCGPSRPSKKKAQLHRRAWHSQTNNS